MGHERGQQLGPEAASRERPQHQLDIDQGHRGIGSRERSRMGAMRAGLRGAWVARGERWLVPVIPDPDVRGDGLQDAARQIAARLAG